MKLRSFLQLSVLALGAVTLGSLLWRQASRRFSIPCPTLLAGTLEGTLQDRLFRTDTTLERIGIDAGQRVLEVGPGPGRLLIPAGARVLPGGSVTGLDLQPGMIKRLMTRAH